MGPRRVWPAGPGGPQRQQPAARHARQGHGGPQGGSGSPPGPFNLIGTRCGHLRCCRVGRATFCSCVPRRACRQAYGCNSLCQLQALLKEAPALAPDAHHLHGVVLMLTYAAGEHAQQGLCKSTHAVHRRVHRSCVRHALWRTGARARRPDLRRGGREGRRAPQGSCGGTHTLVLTAEGRIFTWGRGSFGRLGTGVEKDCHAPVEVFLPGAPRRQGFAS